jgi:hypothetical protein
LHSIRPDVSLPSEPIWANRRITRLSDRSMAVAGRYRGDDAEGSCEHFGWLARRLAHRTKGPCKST